MQTTDFFVHRVGLIINPLAGLGGALARHGSDGLDPQWVQSRAPHSARRAAQAIQVLDPDARLCWFTGHGRLGADLLAQMGYACSALGHPIDAPSQARDTRQLARQLLDAKVDLLLFAGGDGTARDIMDVVGDQVPVLGIPAGVKMQSAVFGNSPKAAGRLASAFLRSGRRVAVPREVMDLDETGLAAGRVAARLYGYLSTPMDPVLLQGKKSRSEADDQTAAQILAAGVAAQLQHGTHLIGPGSTTWAVKQQLGIPGSLIGIDVVRDGQLWLRDADEAQLWSVVQSAGARLWLTAIGGQGHVIGRGNAPLSPRVLQALGPAAMTLLVTSRKLQSLAGCPLKVDSGSPDIDALYSGPVQVVTGPRDKAIVHLVAA